MKSVPPRGSGCWARLIPKAIMAGTEPVSGSDRVDLTLKACAGSDYACGSPVINIRISSLSTLCYKRHLWLRSTRSLPLSGSVPDKSSNYDPTGLFPSVGVEQGTPLIPKAIIAGTEPVSGSDRVDLGALAQPTGRALLT